MSYRDWSKRTAQIAVAYLVAAGILATGGACGLGNETACYGIAALWVALTIPLWLISADARKRWRAE